MVKMLQEELGLGNLTALFQYQLSCPETEFFLALIYFVEISQ
jgi:hypothetical protein